MTSNGTFKLPKIVNEPLYHYAPGSAERIALQEELKTMEAGAPYAVPAFVGGKEVNNLNLIFYISVLHILIDSTFILLLCLFVYFIFLRTLLDSSFRT